MLHPDLIPFTTGEKGGRWSSRVDPAVLVGLIFTSVIKGDCPDGEGIIFENSEWKFQLYHQQYCCEGVYIEDIAGSLTDLVGSPILRSEVSFNSEGTSKEAYDDSHTWSFYKFATNKGYVDIRFYGSSNGYYSETAELYAEYKGPAKDEEDMI